MVNKHAVNIITLQKILSVELEIPCHCSNNESKPGKFLCHRNFEEAVTTNTRSHNTVICWNCVVRWRVVDLFSVDELWLIEAKPL